MKNKKVKMKGLATPTVVVFLHGFFDGRFRTAGIDQDSGLLNSAYTNGKIDLFYKYCNERVDRLETDIASVCAEAETLLIELKSMPSTCKRNETDWVESVKTPKVSLDFAQEAQNAQAARFAAREVAKANVAIEQAKEKRSQIEKRKTDILQCLVQIRNCISNKETNCRNELSATSFALKERMCVYGHGVLLKPILSRNIPQLEYEWAFELYNNNHDEIKQRISEVVNKEDVEHV